MLTLEEMLIRLAVALVLGAVIGFGRELVGKEAGVRTDMIVAAGAALFTIAGLSLPYVVASSPDEVARIIAGNSGFFGLIANVVVGIGFLGAGIIVKQGVHVHGITTAATVWFVAGIGVLSGIGLLTFAAIAAVGVALILGLLSKMDLEDLGKEPPKNSLREESR